ncbi:Outer membrane porin protein [Cupriavidus laharis]|uniref:Outer membrane porin protein n=1 Tax=Cupriavidus laharis TaxID=151654 RepID=A0ABN7YZJ4_9BURK|nr:porin [Cupriavidus laharis]CAG9179149.1 Outer membrane porin protein [Cupriavidus laharis]
MKMKLFAAAVAALAAGGAYAQSSVTLYGVVDAGIEYQNNQPAVPTQGISNGHSVTRLISGGQSGSRWGLRGVEDLGGGLKGLFVLESGFSVDDGKMGQDSRLFGRQAFVGLGSQYGQLTLGRHQTPFYDFGLQFDPMAIASNYSITAQDGAFQSRADNSLKYMGTFGGLTVNALYSFGWNTGGQPVVVNGVTVAGNNGEVPGTWKIGREYSVGLTYAAGPFAVGAVYDETNQGFANNVNPDATLRRASLAGTYAFGPAKLFAGYRWAKGVDMGTIPFLGNTSLQAISGAKASSNLYWLGAGYQVTPAFSLTGAAYYQDFRGAKADPWLFVATADYALSKRTDAYLSLAYAYNRDNSNLGVQGLGKTNVDATGKGDSQFGATVGIRHKF